MLSRFNHVTLTINSNFEDLGSKHELDAYQAKIIESCNKIVYLKCYINITGAYNIEIDSMLDSTFFNFEGVGRIPVYSTVFYLPEIRTTEGGEVISIDDFVDIKFFIFNDLDNKWKYIAVSPILDI